MALFGGVVSGIGAGLVFRAIGYGRRNRCHQPHHPAARRSPREPDLPHARWDVIALQGLTFGWENALYGVVLLFVNGLALDYVLEGPSVVRTLTVVTDKPDVVSAVVFDTMRVGVTDVAGDRDVHGRGSSHSVLHRQPRGGARGWSKRFTTPTRMPSR